MIPPSPAPILDLMQAFRRSQVMFTAVKLGVFDRLRDGPASAAELAAALNVDARALRSVLDACAALDLLTKSEGVYSNSGTADVYLCRESPQTLTGYILYSGAALYPMWGHLDDAVREGTHRWTQTFGTEGPIFSHFFRTEEAMRDFSRGMHGIGLLASPLVAAAFDLSRFRRMVDLGGATGHLVMAACERYPNLSGAVFDLPPVAAIAREYAGGRIEVIEGDFFEDALPEADLFALGRILHDWSDDKIERLLKRIYQRLPAGGALLVAEALLLDDGVGPVSANMQSVNMLICTEGRERTPAEYAAILGRAGFSHVESRMTGGYLDATLAVK
jgi:acetylserotonin N-methyltransferase